jgi:hypothetical protein
MVASAKHPISPVRVRYIKFGASGSWEEECIKRGIACGDENTSEATYKVRYRRLRRPFCTCPALIDRSRQTARRVVG